MRQEPSVYVNGQPMCARPPNKEREILRKRKLNSFISMFREVNAPRCLKNPTGYKSLASY